MNLSASVSRFSSACLRIYPTNLAAVIARQPFWSKTGLKERQVNAHAYCLFRSSHAVVRLNGLDDFLLR